MRRRDTLVGVAPEPRLDARIEVHRALLVAELDERYAGDVDREIEEEIALAEQGLEDRAVVLARQGTYVELYAVMPGFRAAALVALDKKTGKEIWRHAMDATDRPFLPFALPETESAAALAG